MKWRVSVKNAQYDLINEENGVIQCCIEFDLVCDNVRLKQRLSAGAGSDEQAAFEDAYKAAIEYAQMLSKKGES